MKPLLFEHAADTLDSIMLLRRNVAPLLNCICGLLFIAMAILGWFKLRYGFNLLDEGMYMTDGWRLSAGDRLFPDSAINAAMMYAVFNAAVFKLSPGITLLGFRELQQVVALSAIALFAAAIYGWTRRLWLVLLTLSGFAFTGLDVTGASSNLSYMTYSHLFFVLHVSSLLFALNCRNRDFRAALFVAAGVSLWAIGFSFLPLATAMIIPVALWTAMRALGWREEFSFRELLLVVCPGLVLWLIFLAAYGSEFLPAIFNIYRYINEGGVEAGFDRVPMQYVAVAAVFVAVLVAATYRSMRVFFDIAAASVFMMFLIVDTNLFNLVTPFWRGWFPRQMWFCALLIVAMTALPGYLVYRKRRGMVLERIDLLYLVLVLPAGLMALLMSQFSSAGVLATCYVALPASMAIALFAVTRLEKLPIGEGVTALSVAALLLPFYYHLARADWEFTFFDMAPKHLTRVISSGFGAGIHTNEFYGQIVDWMTQTAQAHSRDGDFAIVMDQAPMGYMIIKRRPALNHSFSGWALSASLRRDAVAAMLRQGREPKIAYRFLNFPMIVPEFSTPEKIVLGGQFSYPATDPASQHVTTHMQLVDTFYFQDQPLIEFYARRN